VGIAMSIDGIDNVGTEVPPALLRFVTTAARLLTEGHTGPQGIEAEAREARALAKGGRYEVRVAWLGRPQLGTRAKLVAGRQDGHSDEL